MVCKMGLKNVHVVFCMFVCMFYDFDRNVCTNDVVGAAADSKYSILHCSDVERNVLLMIFIVSND